MTGSTKDPENGPAVAGSVFAAVIVYAVRAIYLHPERARRLPYCVLLPISSVLIAKTLGLSSGYPWVLGAMLISNKNSASLSSAASKPSSMFGIVNEGR